MDDNEASECEAIRQSEFTSGITTLKIAGPTGSGLATLGLHHGQGRQTEVENVGMDVAGQLVHLQYSTARLPFLKPCMVRTSDDVMVARPRQRLTAVTQVVFTVFFTLVAFYVNISQIDNKDRVMLMPKMRKSIACDSASSLQILC